MRYSVSTVINAPIHEVIKRFDNPELMKEWMEGLESFEHLEGTAGQPGAKSKLTFRMGRRTIEMTETITARNLPEVFAGYYEVGNVYNEVSNHFKPLSESTTEYSTTQYFRLTGGMKVIGWLFPKTFKKQSAKYLEDFKSFVERDTFRNGE